jgi:hypothetical protein
MRARQGIGAYISVDWQRVSRGLGACTPPCSALRRVLRDTAVRAWKRRKIRGIRRDRPPRGLPTLAGTPMPPPGLAARLGSPTATLSRVVPFCLRAGASPQSTPEGPRTGLPLVGRRGRRGPLIALAEGRRAVAVVRFRAPCSASTKNSSSASSAPSASPHSSWDSRCKCDGKP